MKKVALLTLVLAFGMLAVSCNNQPKEAAVEEACECACDSCQCACDSCTAACDSCAAAVDSVVTE